MPSGIKKTFLFALSAFICTASMVTAQTNSTDPKLTGTVIGTLKSVDYGTNTASTTVNTRECAFDDNVNTYFAAYDRSFAWVGLDLGQPHVITRIGWSPARRNRGAERLLGGL